MVYQKVAILGADLAIVDLSSTRQTVTQYRHQIQGASGKGQ
jgi:hypothetical protein